MTELAVMNGMRNAVTTYVIAAGNQTCLFNAAPDGIFVRWK